ncbi:hypothetical protein GYMLUDRAFT_437660 [Collybiopsis luxurians FD-317 M1]|uniref:Uncharacterized protein n=1 Tax=Collybiopsis luxurians FD-317 M1 TaxID=944289 RepID=A0A0D0CWL2_9AGAR|nr:hypothetical protein GYMLUDRAFT_437660 [Collybiopsis luxurians FD-317 M1]
MAGVLSFCRTSQYQSDLIPCSWGAELCRHGAIFQIILFLSFRNLDHLRVVVLALSPQDPLGFPFVRWAEPIFILLWFLWLGWSGLSLYF